MPTGEGNDLPMRDPAMDTARGLAVAGMMFVHLVPLDGLMAAARLVVDGTAAALFSVLVGMSWSIQAERCTNPLDLRRFVIRRSLTLLVLGLLVHVLMWPTEILVPFAVMLAPAIWVGSRGPGVMVAAIALLLVTTGLGNSAIIAFSEADWLESGSHLADTTVGWVSVRYLLFDGNYPLVPWLAFPLLGMLLKQTASDRMRTWLSVGVGTAFSMILLTVWTVNNADALGDFAKYISTTWIPTTIPFMLMKGGLAVAVISGLTLRSKVLSISNPLACVGRASLTHYLAHICLVFVPLRLLYPEENWPLLVGFWAYMSYLALAIPLSSWWLHHHKRGPIEQLLSKSLSGRS